MQAFFGARPRPVAREIGLDLWDNSPSLPKGKSEPSVPATEPLPPPPPRNAERTEGSRRSDETLIQPAPAQTKATRDRRQHRAGDRTSTSRSAAKEQKEKVGEKSGTTAQGDNLYVQYLPLEASESDLRDLFANVGVVRSCRIVMDFEKQRSKGYGFVLMGTCADAARAVDTLNGLAYRGKRLLVRFADHSPTAPWPAEGARSDGDAPLSTGRTVPTVSDQLYVKGLPRWWRDGEVRDFFGRHGAVRSVKLLLEHIGAPSEQPTAAEAADEDPSARNKCIRLSKGIALVRFGDASEAKKALCLAGTSPDPACHDPLVLRYAYDPSAARDHNESRRRELARFGQFGTVLSSAGRADARPIQAQIVCAGPDGAFTSAEADVARGVLGPQHVHGHAHDPYLHGAARVVDPSTFATPLPRHPHLAHHSHQGNPLMAAGASQPTSGVVAPHPSYYHSPADYFDAFLGGGEAHPAARQTTESLLHYSSGSRPSSGFPLGDRSDSDVAAQESTYFGHAYAPSYGTSAPFMYEEPMDLLLHYRRHPYGPPANDLEVVVHQRLKKGDRDSNSKAEQRAADDGSPAQQQQQQQLDRKVQRPPAADASQCPYCSTTTSVLISGVPTEHSECCDAVRTLLGAFEETLTISCLGTGEALVGFEDRWNAMNAVQCMQYPPHNVRFACFHLQA